MAHQTLALSGGMGAFSQLIVCPNLDGLIQTEQLSHMNTRMVEFVCMDVW